MANGYRDFIPAQEDPGALGSGFTDFVPVPQQVVPQKETVKTEEKVNDVKKGNK